MDPKELDRIYQNNKLLCKFLGYKLYEKKTLNGVFAWDVGRDPSFVGAELNNSLDFSRNLHFHEDWNWIMVVVERIAEMNDEDFDINRNRVRTPVNTDVCTESLGGYIIVHVTEECPILTAIYEVCVTYVRLYFNLEL